MQPHIENPAAANCGVPKSDLAGCLITSENTSLLRKLQASRLTRRYAISFAMAAIIVPLLHGEARQ
jgi:hypothetical protein